MEKRKQKKYDEIFEKKLDSMEWYVIMWDINQNELTFGNIFHRGRFAEDVKQILHKRGKTKKEFMKELNSACMYSFWSKCEYEIVVNNLIRRGNYDAILNDDSFIIKKEWFAEDKQDIVYEGHNQKALQDNRIEAGPYTIQMKQYDKETKVDVYAQLKPNMERLAEYIIKETGYHIKKDTINE